MSRFKVLINNELKKQYEKFSIKVILILVLSSALVIPSILSYINNKSNSSDYIEFYKKQIIFIDNSLKELNEKNTSNDNIRRLNLEAEKQKWKLLIDNNINSHDWRNETTENWLNKTREIIVLESILKGYDKNNILNNYYGNDIYKIETYFDLTTEELEKTLDKEKEQETILIDSILKNDYLKVAKDKVNLLNNEIEMHKKRINNLQEEIQINPNDKVNKLLMESAKEKLQEQQEMWVIAQYRLDKKIIPNKDNWENETLKEIEELLKIKSQKILDKDEFNKQFTYDISQGLTYDKYKKNIEEKINKAKENIELNWYSLNNHIPQLKFSNDGRGFINSIYMKYLGITIIICIIVAGGIVSSEYSNGTIRLLLIRPVYRWKILLSKLIAVLIIGYGILISSIFLLTISSGLIFGFNSLKINILSYGKGAVIEQSYIIYMILKLLFASISLIFITSLAFFISTILRNTALAVGISAVIFLTNIPAALFMVSFNMRWVTKTIIPYINLSMFEENSYYIEIFKNQYNVSLNPNVGAIQLIFTSIVLLCISFIVFSKRDVGN